MGVAGASFAVALPQASRWHPPQYQGVVMGIVGAGNMGVILETTSGFVGLANALPLYFTVQYNLSGTA